MIAFNCPGCGKSFSVKEEFAGRKTKCPNPDCGIPIVVPASVAPTKVSDSVPALANIASRPSADSVMRDNPESDESASSPNQNEAFGWPPGSIRALLAIIISLAVFFWLWLNGDREVPDSLQRLWVATVFCYFVARKQDNTASGSPLGLPAKSIRGFLVVCFVATASLVFLPGRILSHAQGPTLNPMIESLIEIGGFIAGAFVLLLASIGRNLPRFLVRGVKDIQALSTLTSAVALVLLEFKVIKLSALPYVGEWWSRSDEALTIGLLGAFLLSYFGSRGARAAKKIGLKTAASHVLRDVTARVTQRPSG